MIQRCYYPVTKETFLSIQLPMFSTVRSLSTYSSPFPVCFTIPGETTATNKASRESRTLGLFQICFETAQCVLLWRKWAPHTKQSKPISHKYPISIATRPCWISTGALKNSWLVSYRDNSVYLPQKAGLWLWSQRESLKGRRKRGKRQNSVK